ncbi:hypothetical protein [Legionella impletisoli]|uniref:Uncharacterized protein n=1 Tax=Legionella impletisoli TaxID=343510 RepID=A0A917JP50_9GAMM|nr:hypothetical protein [Legionella impletisoli]GGI79685.1 hypothetical protein GCM10007966_05250 [Legionella impletisoli]
MKTMKTSLDQIVTQTLATITDHIDSLSKKPFLASELDHILRSCLIDAFDSVSNQDHDKLYKAFSLNLHPDRLRNKANKLANYLNQNNAINIPMQVLASISKDQKKPEQSTSHVVLTGLYQMRTTHHRYSKPISTLANILSWTITAISALAWVLAKASEKVVSSLIRLSSYFIESIANFFTFGELNRTIKEYNDSEEALSLAKKVYLDFQRNLSRGLYIFKGDKNLLTLCELDDEAFYSYLLAHEIARKSENTSIAAENLQQEAEKDLNQRIKLFFSVRGITHLRLAAKAFITSITKPMPQGFFNSVFSVLNRIFLSAITPVVLTVIGVTELLKSINEAINLTVTALIAAALVSIHVILNAPLYILDGVRALNQKIQSFFESSFKEASDNHSEPNNSHMFMLTYLRPNSPVVNAEATEEPVHLSGLGMFPQSEPAQVSPHSVNPAIQPGL